MSDFGTIAPYLSNPLVLVGFVLLLFFGIHRTLIKSKIIQPVGPQVGGKIVQLSLRYGFFLVLVVIVMGFVLEYSKLARVPTVETAQASSSLAAYDRLAKMIDSRARESSDHYDEIHQLRMALDRAAPGDTTEIAADVANATSFVHDESQLLALLRPFLREPHDAAAHELEKLLGSVEASRRALAQEGYGPILTRAFDAARQARQDHPERTPSEYESRNPGAIRLLPGELISSPATSEEKSALYDRLLKYELLVEEKGLSLLGLKEAAASSLVVAPSD